MNIYTILWLFYLAVSLPALATEQQLDAVQYTGKRVAILEHPLSGTIWPKPLDNPNPRFDICSTANYKGYVAAWEIRDSKLILAGFSAEMQGKMFPIEKLFPGRKLPIVADWYSGPITVVYGTPTLAKGRWRFERVIKMKIDRGVVVESNEKKPFIWNR